MTARALELDGEWVVVLSGQHLALNASRLEWAYQSAHHHGRACDPDVDVELEAMIKLQKSVAALGSLQRRDVHARVQQPCIADSDRPASVSTREAADLLGGVDASTVRRQAATGKIPGAWRRTEGRRNDWRIPIESLPNGER